MKISASAACVLPLGVIQCPYKQVMFKIVQIMTNVLKVIKTYCNFKKDIEIPRREGRRASLRVGGQERSI